MCWVNRQGVEERVCLRYNLRDRTRTSPFERDGLEMKPVVQISLDLTDLGQALETAKLAIEAVWIGLKPARRSSLPKDCERFADCESVFLRFRSWRT